MPSSGMASGSTSETSVSTTKLAKYRPAASLTTVPVDGVEGSVRVHFTFRSPIFGSRSYVLTGAQVQAEAVPKLHVVGVV